MILFILRPFIYFYTEDAFTKYLTVMYFELFAEIALFFAYKLM